MKTFLTQNFLFFLLFELVTYISSDYNINSIIKAIGLNNFLVRFRLLPGVTMPDGEKIIDYSDAPIWQTTEFIDSK